MEVVVAVIGLVGTVAVLAAIFVLGPKVFPAIHFGPFVSSRMRNVGIVLFGLAAIGWVIGLIGFIEALNASSKGSTTGTYQMVLVGLGCGLALTIVGNVLFQRSRQVNNPFDSRPERPLPAKRP